IVSRVGPPRLVGLPDQVAHCAPQASGDQHQRPDRGHSAPFLDLADEALGELVASEIEPGESEGFAAGPGAGAAAFEEGVSGHSPGALRGGTLRLRRLCSGYCGDSDRTVCTPIPAKIKTRAPAYANSSQTTPG